MVVKDKNCNWQVTGILEKADITTGLEVRFNGARSGPIEKIQVAGYPVKGKVAVDYFGDKSNPFYLTDLIKLPLCSKGGDSGAGEN